MLTCFTVNNGNLCKLRPVERSSRQLWGMHCSCNTASWQAAPMAVPDEADEATIEATTLYVGPNHGHSASCLLIYAWPTICHPFLLLLVMADETHLMAAAAAASAAGTATYSVFAVATQPYRAQFSCVSKGPTGCRKSNSLIQGKSVNSVITREEHLLTDRRSFAVTSPITRLREGSDCSDIHEGAHDGALMMVHGDPYDSPPVKLKVKLTLNYVCTSPELAHHAADVTH